MRKTWLCATLMVACLALASVRAQETAKSGTDETFVYKASAAGLAEVNAANIAVKQASDPAVKRFAEHMITDHTKANKELIDLANKTRAKVAPQMDEEHQKMAARLLRLTGADFDREYMTGQVRDHEVAVSLFQNEAKSGSNADLRSWAEKTLPTLREHHKMAKSIHSKLKGSSTDR